MAPCGEIASTSTDPPRGSGGRRRSRRETIVIMTTTSVTVHCEAQDENKVREAISRLLPDVTSTQAIVDVNTGARITFDTAHPHAVAELTIVKLTGARVVVHD